MRLTLRLRTIAVALVATDLWSVEAGSAPATEGTSLTTITGEHSAFRQSAARAGVRSTERLAFAGVRPGRRSGPGSG